MLFGIVFGFFVLAMLVLIGFVIRFALQNGLKPPKR